MWALLRPPRFGGAKHADDYDNRSRYRQVGFPGVGIEACASSHNWSRELKALGHSVRLMPPAYVKPYVKRQKNDATDAEAICEAVTRANMRFVETKTPEQQSGLMLHRTRHLFIRQQTVMINAIRAHLAEFGISGPCWLRRPLALLHPSPRVRQRGRFPNLSCRRQRQR